MARATNLVDVTDKGPLRLPSTKAVAEEAGVELPAADDPERLDAAPAPRRSDPVVEAYQVLHDYVGEFRKSDHRRPETFPKAADVERACRGEVRRLIDLGALRPILA